MGIKPRSLVVLIDMDDTITDLLGAWVEMLNIRHGTSVNPADVRQWDIAKSFPTLTSEQVFAPLLCDDLWYYVHPKDGAVETVERIMQDGHKVYIVTTSSYETTAYIISPAANTKRFWLTRRTIETLTLKAMVWCG